MISTILKLGEKYTLWAKELVSKRRKNLELAHQGQMPIQKSLIHPDPIINGGNWKIVLPEWCKDQRNQMTGPSDDIELVVKMINSGAPGVMLDLEDSLANTRQNIRDGINNCIRALEQRASYVKEGTIIEQKEKPVLFVRPRGLHLFDRNHEGDLSSAFYDVVQVADNIMTDKLQHNLCFYIPKSESAEEALWWRDLFRELADIRGWKTDYIKCMALVESFPLAHEIEEFIYNLRDHILGLNLGRWDYMASVLEWNFENPNWVLPDRNTIPHDVEFFQNLRETLVHVCHKRGILAIGGMTALFPSRYDPILNKAALHALEQDKKNESAFGFDGAWTGHPDQNQIAIDQFPFPNQLSVVPPDRNLTLNVPPELDLPRTLGENGGMRLANNVTEAGTRMAIRTCILYRYHVLKGKGASLINGYMEDLATDRIYRTMIAQRFRHWYYNADQISNMFSEEKARIIQSGAGCISWTRSEIDMLALEEAAFLTIKSVFEIGRKGFANGIR